MIYKRLRPRIVILFLLLSVVQMAMAEINDVASVQVEPADQTNADEKTAEAVSGWPAHYGGVMLQGFYWGSFDESSWEKLGSADTVAQYSKYFDLIWVPQSGGMPYQGSRTMGYMPYYYFDHNSCFGSQDKLKAMIAAYKAKGTGIIEDVVINHRSSINQTDLLSFPTETYKGTDYHFTSSDVLNDDDGGATKAYLDYLNSLTDTKISLSSYGEETCSSVDRQTCESFDGARDLDHRSLNVQNTIKAYEKFLLDGTDGLGYSGFRYDMARGFLPTHLVDYNKSAKPRFSVGEVFDGNFNEVKWWLNHWTDTTTVDGKQKITRYNAAFDFPMHFSVMTQGFKNSDFSQRTGAFTLDASGKRTNTPLISDRALSRYAVTFVDNHDTYYPRYDLSMKNADNMVTSNILAANAYILGMPGTPCIYFKHWLDPVMRPVLEQLIMARKAAGIDNMSQIIQNGYDPDDGDGYFAEVEGKGGAKVFMTFGQIDDKALNETLSDKTKWMKVAGGENFNFYISADVSDTYNKYMDGTEAPARWTDSSNDETVTDADNVSNSTTSTIQLNGRRVCIYTTSPKLYAYICQGNSWTQLTGSFPGVDMMQNSDENHVTTQTITGQDGKSRKYHIIEVYSTDYLNIVLSTGDLNAQGQGINQTNDITGLTDNDVYLTFTPGDESVSNGKIATYANITEEVTGNVKNDSVYAGYDIGTHSVYFENTIGWYNPKITVWNEDASGAKTYFTSGGADNSQALTTVVMGNKPYYVWNYTGDETSQPTSVLFSSGSSAPQSVSIPFEDNSVYELSLTSKDASGQYDLERTTSADKWGRAADNSVPAKTEPGKYELDEVNSKPYSDYKEKIKFTIYFHNSVGWNEPHLWAWNNSGNFTGGEWSKKPAMTKTKLNGKDVWAWTYDPDNLPAGYTPVNGLPTMVIFAAADQPQSAELVYKEGGVYKLSVTDKTNGDNTGSKHKLAEGSGQEDKEMQFLNRLYTRYVREGVISTLCLPFDLTSAELSAMKLRVYDLATADAVVDKNSTATDGLLSFHRVRNVEAFHPYIFINNSSTSGRIFNSKIISRKEWQWPSPEKSLGDLKKTVGDWTLQGNLVPAVVKTDSTGDGKTTYFGYAESTQSFIQMKKGKAFVPASVCYFTLPTEKVKKAGYRFEGGDLSVTDNAQTTGAKHFVVTLDDDSSTADVYVFGDGTSVATAINGITAGPAPVEDAPMFNLAGQRVNKDYRGVVIQNGHKFILK